MSLSVQNPTTKHLDPADYETFLKDAKCQVLANQDAAVDLIRAGGLGPGFWHPTGFAIFDFLRDPELGRLRIHFWPTTPRRRLQSHPPIHCHSFQLHSLILAGTYTETQYTIESSHSSKKDQLGPSFNSRRYLVQPMVGDLDEIEEIAMPVRPVVSIPTTNYPAGTTHDIEAGYYHSTPIPTRTFCCTFAVLSNRPAGAHDFLVGRPGVQPLKNLRRLVTEQERHSMCEEFVNAYV